MSRPLFQLNPRLKCCASLLRPGKRMADIGTDHAYLPIWAIRQGLTSYAVASDINEGPLEAARRNMIRYHTSDNMELRLSDGLNAFSPGDADDIVIAGMGGELIAKILAGAPWLKAPEKRLILQPMTRAPELRTFLASEGYEISREIAVEDSGRVYAVMLAGYTGKAVKTGRLYPYIGMVTGETAEGRRYLENCAALLRKRAQGLRLEGKEDDARELFSAAEEISGLAAAEPLGSR